MTNFRVGDKVTVKGNYACDKCFNQVWTIKKISKGMFDTRTRHLIDAPCKGEFTETALTLKKSGAVKNWKKELGRKNV